jgi:hypothetical protein
MPTLKRLFLVAICFATLAAACWGRYAESNDEHAYLAGDGQIYRVEMKGWRFPLVHDPVSLLLGRTRETTVTMELPRIEGVIDGSEIPVGRDKIRYLGQVVISNRKMKVALYYKDGRPLLWNDEYTLVQRETPGTR